MAVLFSLLQRQTLIRRPHLLGPSLTEAQRRLILRRSGAGLVPYLIATGLAFVSPYLTIAICAGLAVFYALPLASGSDIGTDPDTAAGAGR